MRARGSRTKGSQAKKKNTSADVVDEVDEADELYVNKGQDGDEDGEANSLLKEGASLNGPVKRKRTTPDDVEDQNNGSRGWSGIVDQGLESDVRHEEYSAGRISLNGTSPRILDLSKAAPAATPPTMQRLRVPGVLAIPPSHRLDRAGFPLQQDHGRHYVLKPDGGSREVRRRFSRITFLIFSFRSHLPPSSAQSFVHLR